jgi:hypothetical protein
MTTMAAASVTVVAEVNATTIATAVVTIKEDFFPMATQVHGGGKKEARITTD